MDRLRDLGIELGTLTPGPLNAITDIDGVRVGHTTVIAGHATPSSREVAIRSGVTVIRPRAGYAREHPLFAGSATLNGNGEMTGLEWVRESGLLTTDIALTNTHSVGVVRDALVTRDVRDGRPNESWSMPIVGETSDLSLNGGNGQHVTAEHVFQALDSARSGPVAEGSVGGGTGMVCHGFKGGIGTASRRLPADAGGWTVGVLVQANHGSRRDFRVDGVPVGRSDRFDDVPLPGLPEPRDSEAGYRPEGAGSIIVVVGTDAPLLPDQCQRLARRASLGIARVGGGLNDSSGDIFIAFATGNNTIPAEYYAPDNPATFGVRSVSHQQIDGLLRATVEACEESIVNAMLAANTMVGHRGFTAHGLDPERLRQAMADRGRR